MYGLVPRRSMRHDSPIRPHARRRHGVLGIELLDLILFALNQPFERLDFRIPLGQLFARRLLRFLGLFPDFLERLALGIDSVAEVSEFVVRLLRIFRVLLGLGLQFVLVVLAGGLEILLVLLLILFGLFLILIQQLVLPYEGVVSGVQVADGAFERFLGLVAIPAALGLQFFEHFRGMVLVFDVLRRLQAAAVELALEHAQRVRAVHSLGLADVTEAHHGLELVPVALFLESRFIGVGLLGFLLQRHLTVEAVIAGHT